MVSPQEKIPRMGAAHRRGVVGSRGRVLFACDGCVLNYEPSRSSFRYPMPNGLVMLGANRFRSLAGYACYVFVCLCLLSHSLALSTRTSIIVYRPSSHLVRRLGPLPASPASSRAPWSACSQRPSVNGQRDLVSAFWVQH